MQAQVLIAGHPERRSRLAGIVRQLGYAVELVPPDALRNWLDHRDAPGLVVVCAEDADVTTALAQLRRTRWGASVPVVLAGGPGTRGYDLAAVLDLGADHLVDEQAGPEVIGEVLEQLVGPPNGVSSDGPGSAGSALSSETVPDAIGAVEAWTGASPASGFGPARDPALKDLQHMLDLVEARLAERDDTHDIEDADPQDDLDLATLGLENVPDVDDAFAPADEESQPWIADEEAAASRLLSVGETGERPRAGVTSTVEPAFETGGRERTLRLDNAAPRPLTEVLPVVEETRDLAEAGHDDFPVLGLDRVPVGVSVTDVERIQFRLGLVRDADYFAVLGVSRDATSLEIRGAFRLLWEAFNDEVLSPETVAAYANELKELREGLEEARDILVDEGLRTAYRSQFDEDEAVS